MGATSVAPNTSFCPFAASRIRCAKLRLPLTPLRDILLKRCSKIVPGKHTPPFSGGFRPPFTRPAGRAVRGIGAVRRTHRTRPCQDEQCGVAGSCFEVVRVIAMADHGTLAWTASFPRIDISVVALRCPSSSKQLLKMTCVVPTLAAMSRIGLARSASSSSL